MNSKISILLIEDNPPDARYVQELLSRTLYSVTTVKSLTEARALATPNSFDLVLLDLSLPDGQGLETFLSLTSFISMTPVIILTGLEDEEVSLQAVKLGAQDYILKKEISDHLLSRSIRYAIQRKQTEEGAKRLAVLEQREEFMATLTHDLKSPLIGANRVLELMADQTWGGVTAEQSHLLLQIRDNNRQLLMMIQNLIEVYRFEKEVNAVTLEHTNLLKIIYGCMADIEPIVKNRNIEMGTEFPEKVTDVLADAMAIRRVIQNLLDNAIKFTPSGGQIMLRIQPTDQKVVLEVADTGSGIPTEEQGRMFQRFSQGRRGRKYTPGTGLGLYLCKQIIDAHHGEITFTSRETVGTTFRVTLPTN